jgi:hypothetical protein
MKEKSLSHFLGKRVKLHTRIQAFCVFSEYYQINVIAIIERIARIGFTGS